MGDDVREKSLGLPRAIAVVPPEHALFSLDNAFIWVVVWFHG